MLLKLRGDAVVCSAGVLTAAAAPAAPHAATAGAARDAGAAGAAATPRDPKDNVIDYAMFEQLWLADLTSAAAK